MIPIYSTTRTERNSTINPAMMGNTRGSIVKACTPVIDLKVGVSLDHSVSLCFTAPQTLWTTFQAKNNVKGASASTALV